MKFILVILILSGSGLISAAQQINPYLVIVQTTSGKEKGILYKVDSAWLAIDGKNGFARVKSDEIRSIKVRADKRNYKVRKLVKYDPWDEGHFESNVYGAPVRKWGEKDPSVKEEISGHIGTSLINVLVNVIAAPIHAINPGIARIRFDDRTKFADQVYTLSYYSIHYQANRDELKELQQIKSIGEAFKRRSH